MFLGLIIHGLLSECVGRAPGLVVGNVNYVKKVVFPLEALACVTLGTALFHAAASFVVWAGMFVVLNGYLPWTFVLLPVVLFPLALVLLGLMWFLASLGVFFRDIGQIVGFLCPLCQRRGARPRSAFAAWQLIDAQGRRRDEGTTVDPALIRGLDTA
jgi:lipopolysaccharide transport system permease protein